jgi:anti-sigma factor RsiW
VDGVARPDAGRRGDAQGVRLIEEAFVDCVAVIDKLSAFIDGELPDPERRAVERHLLGCAGCASAHQHLADAWTLAAEAPRVTPRVDLWPRIEARLDAGPPWRAWLGRFTWNPLPALATLMLVAGLLLGLQMGAAMAGGGRSAAQPSGTDASVRLLGEAPGSLAEIVLEVAAPAGEGAR